jgi:hypothetical protein
MCSGPDSRAQARAVGSARPEQCEQLFLVVERPLLSVRHPVHDPVQLAVLPRRLGDPHHERLHGHQPATTSSGGLRVGLGTGRAVVA